MKGTARILLIDDDESFRKILDYNLKKEGQDLKEENLRLKEELGER